MDLASLFSQLQASQQAKSSTRLSERNVIELVNKLKQLGVIGDDLLHTINGKEYLTTARLKLEIQMALKQAGGRLSLVELPALLGVDLVHCERQSGALVAESGGGVIEAQGELLTTQYFESISAEINDLLQEMGQLSVSDLALQYGLATELLLRILNQHLDTTIQGRLESGLLYTPAALRRLKAQLRGALRGLVQPAALPAVVKELGLDSFGASTSMICGLVEELVTGREVSGILRGGGTGWLPNCYAAAQQAALTAFYEQNSWVGYELARKLGFSSERAHLSKAFPTGIPLESVFVHPSVLARVQAAVEEALAADSWVDVAPLLPSVLTSADVARLLQFVPLLAKASKAGAGEAEGPRVVAGTCVMSGALVTALAAEVAGAARVAAGKALTEKRVGLTPGGPGGQKAGTTQGGKGGVVKSGKDDGDDEDWGMGSKKGKGGGKTAGKGGVKVKGTTVKGDTGGGGGGGPGVNVSDLVDQVAALHPDMEGAGEGSGLVKGLAQVLLPNAISAWEAALAAAFTVGAESRRQAKDSLSKALDDAFTRLCLYSSGVEHFAPADLGPGTEPTAAGGKVEGKGGKAAAKAAAAAATAEGDDGSWSLMERHVVKTAGAECVDLIFKWANVDVVAQQEDGVASAIGTQASAISPVSTPPLTAAERSAVMRASPPDVVSALQVAVEGAAATTTKAAASAIEQAARDLGLRLRRPDKKNEKPAVSAVKAQLMATLSGEQDAAAALALVVPLLFIKATGKAIGAVLRKISKDLPPETLSTIQEFHTQVVQYLKVCNDPAQGAPLSEDLAARLPGVKALVGLEQSV